MPMGTGTLGVTCATVCVLSLGAACSHMSAAGTSSSSTTRGVKGPTTTTSSPVLGTGGDALYGDYTRPEFGLIKQRALRNHSDAWSVLFPEPGAWKGVVGILYWGHKKPLGRLYAYQATRDGKLELGAETLAPDRRVPRLKRGGFTCRQGHALYLWSRSSDYTLLRLRPIRDWCAVRRRILTADWSFID
jgi:hypothetical protein